MARLPNAARAIFGPPVWYLQMRRPGWVLYLVVSSSHRQPMASVFIISDGTEIVNQVSALLLLPFFLLLLFLLFLLLLLDLASFVMIKDKMITKAKLDRILYCMSCGVTFISFTHLTGSLSSLFSSF